MESRNKLTMCRLCLSENECFINIFELNDWQGFVAAEVISDLLQFKVSETDGYPHVVCSSCHTKLTDFKLFKECCQKSKLTYDKMFILSDGLATHQPEMDIGEGGSGLELFEQDPLKEKTSDVTIKSEEVIIDSSSYEVSEDQLIETEVSCGPILLKYEVLPFNRDSRHQETVIQFSNKTAPHCTPFGAVDADSCNRTIITNDELVFVKSKSTSISVAVEALPSGTMERSEGALIPPGERIYNATLYQKVVSIDKERDRDEEDKEGEGERQTAAGKDLKEEREGFKCYYCGILFKTKVGLKKHMVLHGFSKTYDFEVCGKGCESNAGHIIHMRSHTGEKPYKCTECGKSFSESSNLTRHRRTHTGLKPYKCTECGKSFSESGNLKKHGRTHTGLKPYECTECGKGFSESGNLKKHGRTHTGLKPYKCTECGKSFAQNAHHEIHMRSHKGYEPYKCAECNKCFIDNRTLKRHMRTHTGCKPHQCAECSKSFSENGKLKIHMRIHTGSKPYKCAECGKSFAQNGNLKIHMRTHILLTT